MISPVTCPLFLNCGFLWKCLLLWFHVSPPLHLPFSLSKLLKRVMHSQTSPFSSKSTRKNLKQWTRIEGKQNSSKSICKIEFLLTCPLGWYQSHHISCPPRPACFLRDCFHHLKRWHQPTRLPPPLSTESKGSYAVLSVAGGRSESLSLDMTHLVKNP